MTAPVVVDGHRIFPTYEKALAERDKQQRDHGVITGLIHAESGWMLRCDLEAGMS